MCLYYCSCEDICLYSNIMRTWFKVRVLNKWLRVPEIIINGCNVLWSVGNIRRYVCERDYVGVKDNGGSLWILKSLARFPASIIQVYSLFFLIALLLSAKRPKSPHSQQERRPSACSAGNDNMHLPRAFLFIFFSSYDLANRMYFKPYWLSFKFKVTLRKHW